MIRLVIDSADMQQAAETSDGRYYTWQTAGDLQSNLPSGRQVRVEPLPPEPIWNSWQFALLFVVLLVTEWIMRRQVGMV